MEKILLTFALGLFLPLASGCSSATSDEPENVIGTTVRAAAYFSEVGSVEQINVITVGKTYAVNLAPYSNLSPELADFIDGSVTSVTYYLDNDVMGVSTKQPFTITYTPVPQMEGKRTIKANLSISPNDHNQWIEVEGRVEVVAAE